MYVTYMSRKCHVYVTEVSRVCHGIDIDIDKEIDIEIEVDVEVDKMRACARGMAFLNNTTHKKVFKKEQNGIYLRLFCDFRWKKLG